MSVPRGSENRRFRGEAAKSCERTNAPAAEGGAEARAAAEGAAEARDVWCREREHANTWASQQCCVLAQHANTRTRG